MRSMVSGVVNSTRLSTGSVWKFVGVMLVLAAAGCHPSAVFSVVRPAMINARQYGSTMTVGSFGGQPQAATEVVQDLRQRIVGSEGGIVRYLEGGAGLTIHGDVTNYTYQENVESNRGTCSRMVGEGQNRRRVEYACTHYIRRGRAE